MRYGKFVAWYSFSLFCMAINAISSTLWALKGYEWALIGVAISSAALVGAGWRTGKEYLGKTS